MLSIVLAAARGRILFSHPIYYPMSFYWGMRVLVLWDINEQCLLIPAISLFWCRFIPSPLICWHNIIYSLCFHRCGQPFQDEVFFLEPFDELDSKVFYSVRWTIINKERWEDFFLYSIMSHWHLEMTINIYDNRATNWVAKERNFNINQGRDVLLFR